ncbi:hypothetical protein AGLY_006741 [Aphis glycines]|uniref:Uncharacterized protein n=1 Tax=Aphis glycines TaxID=307491 RepID=A0A6G0TRD1_APHGL|nr:hypothetical protein AGLY_006741 [Aphis glycines]
MTVFIIFRNTFSISKNITLITHIDINYRQYKSVITAYNNLKRSEFKNIGTTVKHNFLSPTRNLTKTKARFFNYNFQDKLYFKYTNEYNATTLLCIVVESFSIYQIFSIFLMRDVICFIKMDCLNLITLNGFEKSAFQGVTSLKPIDWLENCYYYLIEEYLVELEISSRNRDLSMQHNDLQESKVKKSRQVGTTLLYIKGWGGPQTKLFEAKLMENLVLNFLTLDINTNNFMNFELQNNLQIFMILTNFCQNLNFKC